MIVLAMLVALAELPPQRLEAGRCALALWTREVKPRRIAMLFAEPPVLRLDAGGVRDLARDGASAGGALGFAPRTRYANAAMAVTVDLELTTVPGFAGAIARSGSMRIEPREGDAAVLPVAGIAACASRVAP